MDNKNIYIHRAKYTDSLRLGFDKVLEGQGGLAVIQGDAGSGKTHLFESTQTFFKNNNALIIKSKSLQHSNSATSGMASVIDDIITNLLVFEHESFDIVKRTYMDTMGPDLAYIAEISNQVSKAFPNIKYSANKNLKPSSIRRAILQFLKSSANIFFPLVLFMDDLQWCDELTISIINEIIKDSSINLYLVLSFRTHEMNTERLKIHSAYGHTSINIPSFNHAETKNYISQHSKIDNEKLDKISGAVYMLTNGNAFHVKTLMDRLLEERSSEINIADIKSMELTYGVKHILHDKIDALDFGSKHILNTLACMGGSADINLLEIAYRGTKDIKDNLNDLAIKGMLIEKNGKYAFVHDILHDYIYNSISEDSRTELVKTLINNLVAAENAKNYSDMIASLCLSVDRSQLTEKSDKYIEHLYNSAMYSKQSTAFDKSLKLFELCDYLISDKDKSDLWIKIQIDYIECLYISENIDIATNKYEDIRKKCTNSQITNLDMSFLNCYAFSADWENVLNLGEEILKRFNFSLSKNSIIIDLIRFRYMYRKSSLQSMFKATQMDNERVNNILTVLAAMFPAANRIDADLFTKIVLKLALLTARYGNSIFSGISYSCAVYLMYHAFNDYKLGSLIQQMTMNYLNNSTQQRSIPYALIGTFTYHFSNSFEDTIHVLEKSIYFGREENEFMYSNYARVFSIITRYVMGESLSNLKAYISEVMKEENRIENYLTRHMCRIHMANIDYLITGNDDDCDIPKDKPAFYDTIFLNYQMLIIHRLFITGETRKAYNLAEEIECRVNQHKGFVLNGDFYFYSALSRIAIYNALYEKEKRRNIKLIKKHIKNFGKLSKYKNNSHKAKSLLLKAEYSQYIKGKEDNEKNYYRAMTFAKKDDNTQMTALANLLAGKRHIYNLKLSKFYASEAAKLYRIWGAKHIAEIIEAQFSVVREDVVISHSKQPEYIVKMSQDLVMVADKDEAEVVKKFTDTILDFDGIKRCAILFEESGEICISYDKELENDYGVYNENININHLNNLPHGMLRYVFRTQENINSDSDLSKVLLQDSHIAASGCSVVCVPLFSYEVMIGCVYIEHEGVIDINGVNKVINTFSPIILSKRLNGSTAKKDVQTKGEIVLTKRETEIAELLNLGLSNEEISKKAFISVGTVRNHISSIYNKLGVKSRIQAVIKLHELGII